MVNGVDMINEQFITELMEMRYRIAEAKKLKVINEQIKEDKIKNKKSLFNGNRKHRQKNRESCKKLIKNYVKSQ